MALLISLRRESFMFGSVSGVIASDVSEWIASRACLQAISQIIALKLNLQVSTPRFYPAPMTLEEFARSGGKARAKKLSKARRREIALAANRARWKKKRA